ncbi:MAG: DMT family transporter [Burkholderiales bacterium]|nr:DMT family transporter [Burkholderiales bacterium]
MSRTARGYLLGLLGVTIFAATLPMTRLAVGTAEAPLMSGVFIAMGRAALAALLSLFLLAFTRAPRPARGDWPLIAVTAAGVVFGFPLFTSIAMRHVEAVHASVMVGVLPLATAAVGALMNRQRPSVGFWLCALAGSALVAAFAVLRSGGAAGSLAISLADTLLLLAMLCAAVGYSCGARLSQRLRADHVICWALVVSLPVTLPATLFSWPAQPVGAAAWWALGYVAVFSMWLGFFAWYHGLALGGTVRISQVQLAQPFLSMLFAVPLLGERLDAVTIGFGLAVIATVFLGRKMPVGQPRTSRHPHTIRSQP